MNNLNFSNEAYKNTAINFKNNENNNHTYIDAFFLLIKDVKFLDLDNLCRAIQKYFFTLSNPIHLSLEDCYNITQNNNLDNLEKQTIVELAENLITNGINLGSNTINNGKINTSSWISHSFFSSKVCETLASELDLNPETAKIKGLMHDYGRKFDHTFTHTIKGFEELTNLGWSDEGIACLTHSFVNGGRCSNNEPALEGFYLDENGNAKWKENSYKDDITFFLENYKYTEYDILLNIADLMATSKGILSPKERIEDIATRRNIDPTNRGYFLCDLTNTLINILKKQNLISEEVNYIKADKNTNINEINHYFELISDFFFKTFSNMQIKKNQHKI